MSAFYHQLTPICLPKPASRESAALGHEKWHEAISAVPEITEQARDLARQDTGKRVLDAIFGNSPFLTECVVRDPAFTLDMFGAGPDATFAAILATLDETAREANTETLLRILRQAKRRAALTIALADISGAWSLAQVTGALTTLAEATLSQAARAGLREAARRGGLELAHPEDPERDSGLVIIGMGKLGARELNYSSDIDLIVLYDQDVVQTADPDELQQTFVRLTRNLVKAMDERTRDGYVFRTDLRLRPDPASTPLALSVTAAETYYETVGQNWERSAMIKARPVAGDVVAGRRFLDHLRPFIWRKHLDFASIQDIHAIKRQINAHKGGGVVKVLGHNIKLGRGGIREIEFFAQTQQLIWGGRVPELRSSGTCDALCALAEQHRVDAAVSAELVDSYGFLRRLEHRLQMIEDRQTQTLPDDEAELEALAIFFGYEGSAPFIDDLLHHLRRVESHYAHLFEETAEGVEAPGNLVFIGADTDPDTLETLNRLGFTNPQAIDSTVRTWHRGRYRGLRSRRSREILTQLMQSLLVALGRTVNPDAAFFKFDEFLSRLPAGIQLFAMFQAHPELLGLVAELMGGAPRLANHLAHNPTLLDAVLTQDFFAAPPTAEDMDQEIDQHLRHAEYFEDVLEIIRRWANDRRFQVGAQTLRGLLDCQLAGNTYTAIAEAALSRLLPRVTDEFARRHGHLRGDGMVVVGMGKLGSGEMTPTSDLDLIFVYEVEDLTATSDGDKPLAASQYYARLSQRFINAITAMTPEGSLYEVDMRLRPSGRKGPIASSLEAFAQYQTSNAWTWEHMALTRARVIAGEPTLRQRVSDLIRQVLGQPRDGDALVRDVADMRRRMAAEHTSDFIWETKHRRGGLVDVEFIAQYLQLRHAHHHPEVLVCNTREAFLALCRAGALDEADLRVLLSALRLWHTVQNMLRLTIEGRFTAERAGVMPEGLKVALTLVTGVDSFEDLVMRMDHTAEAVLSIFDRLIDDPARALGPAPQQDSNEGASA